MTDHDEWGERAIGQLFQSLKTLAQENSRNEYQNKRLRNALLKLVKDCLGDEDIEQLQNELVRRLKRFHFSEEVQSKIIAGVFMALGKFHIEAGKSAIIGHMERHTNN